ncbi:uncharacterized protein LOC123682301 isoform X2 [Harmonia axyridis]|uniref:uncharacterized protein LOC123682301 isoform X2 n=1 Tax=Harmonia axyridis TaxID=115357 RepID=UPI001E275635|nr:uncharacterized protein LOC123682301 isoform X2 [Harmonia axyridis]
MKKVLSAMKQTEAETVLDEQPPEELPLLPCHVCSRTFLPKPLEKHIRICEQTARRKRKPFDSLKQRVEGTDMAPFYQKSYLKRSNPEMSSQAMAGDVYGNNKQSKWREKHFELQKTIKHAKGTKLDMNTNPPTNISITPNKKVGHSTIRQVSTNERCPVCDRSFGPKAFDRHVEFCREQKNRVPVHKSPAVVQQAKERLEARINYRVPPLKQTKRSLVREKYCPSSQTNLLHRSNSIVSGKNSNALSSSVTTMLPNRRQSMNDKMIERNSKTEIVSKTRLDKTMGDCGDIKEITKNESSNSNKSFHTKRIIPAKKINKTEINDSLQGITVSSLSVEKDKKLVTWKDTVKAQPKVTSSISLTTTSSIVKRNVDCINKEGSRKLNELDKSSSLGKVFKNRLMTEKLSMLMRNKKSEEIEATEDPAESTNLNDTYTIKATLSADLALIDSNEEMHDVGNDEALDFSELNDISEEGELEVESQKDMTESQSNNFNRMTVSYIKDVEDGEQEVENFAKLSLDHNADFSDKYNITSSDEQSEQEYISRENECVKFDSGEDTKTEDTSSLCLRLPLEGMESRVKLKNNDLDPDQKLRNNIKGFYEIMKARRRKVAKEREQLCLLESSKDIRCHLDSTSVKLSAKSSRAESEVVEKFEENDLSEKAGVELPLDIVETDSRITRTDFIRNEKRNGTIRSAGSVSKGNITFTIASRHLRTWKRRKKTKKYRMCVKCFIRNIRRSRHLRWKNKMDALYRSHLETSDVETGSESPQVLQETESPDQSKDPTICTNILFRKSISADCMKKDRSILYNEENETFQTEKNFRSHPNILLMHENSHVTNTNHRTSSENSFDYVIPRKKRKISASFMNLMSDEEKTEINLKQNISKIRKRKKEEEPPLILDYDNIGPSASITSASVLYINKVFTNLVTPERSEIESVDDYEDEEIKEYGDEELEGWEVAEEELRKELEKRKMLTRCESPTKLSKNNVDSFVYEESGNSIGRSNANIDMKRTESVNTLKNSSACTIVNINCGGTTSAKSLVLPGLGRENEVKTIQMAQEKMEISKETYLPEPIVISTPIEKKPCRLPRIIPRNKQTDLSRSLEESTETDIKLPVIINLLSLKEQGDEVTMPNDELIQVPSRATKDLISFCQQTSKMFIDKSSSINKYDIMEEPRNKLSPESRKNKNNRRLETSSLSVQTSMEIRKTSAEGLEEKEECFNLTRMPTAEELYPDNPTMYEEFRKYEEMYRREKESRSSSSKKQKKKTTDFGINIEEDSKAYGDSAYGSLNRKQQIKDPEGSDQAGEFGSKVQSSSTNSGERLPKYCHECGNKYPVATAKFCVECGVKRLVL